MTKENDAPGGFPDMLPAAPSKAVTTDSTRLLGARRAEKLESEKRSLTSPASTHQVETVQVETFTETAGDTTSVLARTPENATADATDLVVDTPTPASPRLAETVLFAAETSANPAPAVESEPDLAEPVVLPEPAEKVEPIEEATVAAEATENATQDRLGARDRAVDDKPRLLALRSFLIALAVPLAIFALSARAIASTLFTWIEYNRPGFPADGYGFTADERMRYASYGVNYILNFAPQSYLSELSVNSQTKLFLATEVAHMTDVKHVMLTGMGLAIFMVLLALLCTRSLTHRSPGTIRKSLFAGSLLTIVLMVLLAVLAFLGWDTFFTDLHRVLFPQGNWEFRMSDSLIRLYPPQYWVDAGIGFALIALVLSIILLAQTWPSKNRRARAKLLREFRDDQRKLLRGSAN